MALTMSALYETHGDRRMNGALETITRLKAAIARLEADSDRYKAERDQLHHTNYMLGLENQQLKARLQRLNGSTQ